MSESHEYEERVWLMTKGLIEGLQREREELLVALKHIVAARGMMSNCQGCRDAEALIERLDRK